METENSGREEEFEEAKKYLRRLLQYRPRTEAELEKRLGKKGYCQEVVGRVIEWGRENDLVNDELFAEYFVEDRLQNKPKGRSGLYKELLDHGVSKEIAQDVLDSKLSENEEENLCRELARKRLKKYNNDEVKAKYRKTIGFLERRGFARSSANSILKELLFEDE